MPPFMWQNAGGGINIPWLQDRVEMAGGVAPRIPRFRQALHRLPIYGCVRQEIKELVFRGSFMQVETRKIERKPTAVWAWSAARGQNR
jgi:hypothetical protein